MVSDRVKPPGPPRPAIYIGIGRMTEKGESVTVCRDGREH